MADPFTALAMAAALILGFSITSAGGLKAWNGWLELKRLHLVNSSAQEPRPPSPTARSDLAELKERVRKLEAIANGVDF
jgi:hypothetical protein